jgi:hypothetical protein
LQVPGEPVFRFLPGLDKDLSAPLYWDCSLQPIYRIVSVQNLFNIIRPSYYSRCREFATGWTVGGSNPKRCKWFYSSSNCAGCFSVRPVSVQWI